ncbi:MAG: right-handed parallel beta-helix repeat-containing protein [Planctomycetaceae bacterium]|nr:right-handed parallel beta-helix repeat-containing protein [Planctomycetaceae bacterium]
MSPLNLYVSPTGSDRNCGSEAEPFRTPEAARDALRRKKNRAGAVVYLRGGIYELNKSFTLDRRDGGSAKSPITWRSYPGEQARFVGGRKLPGDMFKPVTSKAILSRIISKAARRKVVQIDLRKCGITDFGELAVRGFGGGCKAAHLELFFNGLPMQLARYPNDGYLRISGVESKTTFKTRGRRMALWSKAEDLWLHGNWDYIWADLYVPVAGLDAKKRTITVAREQEMKKGRPFYAVNLLEEIDAPGEWYLDRKSGLLYFWPPADPRKADVVVSVLKEELLRVEGAAHLRFEDLTFEVGRANLVRVQKGDDVVFTRCTIKNAGIEGGSIHGRGCGLTECEVAWCGNAGISLHGGDRPKLIRGDNFVTHCRMHHFGRWCKTYTPAVAFEGVGHTVAHNEFSEGPHAAVLFGGNDHRVEYNHIHHVGQYASNGGAIYIGLGWDQRGNLIRYNYLHDLKGRIPGGEYGIMAIYLDDCNSGNTVHGNIVSDVVGFGLLMGGGRDNIITNNIFVRCGEAFGADSRGIERIIDETNSHWNLLRWMKGNGINHKTEPWASAYPKLARIPDSWEEIQKGRWRYPEGCVFSRNLGWDNKKFIHTENSGGDGTLKAFAQVKDNVENADPCFVDQSGGNVSLRDDSPAWKINGFQRIPVEKIGPQPGKEPRLE